jgi:hypothetical protein
MICTIYQKLRCFTTDEVSVHNCAEDCWVSIFSLVYDLTELVACNRGPLTEPIVRFAGQDISQWFDLSTLDVRSHIDETTNVRMAYVPMGRFLHVPPGDATTDWNTRISLQWWIDPQYVIGRVSTNTLRVRIVNMLSGAEDLLNTCAEETVQDIVERYLEYNAHAESYTWKALKDGNFVSLQMDKTLTENEVVDEQAELDRLGIDQDAFIPRIHLYFNDDLTIA